MGYFQENLTDLSKTCLLGSFEQGIYLQTKKKQKLFSQGYYTMQIKLTTLALEAGHISVLQGENSYAMC